MASSKVKEKKQDQLALGSIGFSLEAIEKGEPGQAAFHNLLVEVVALENIPEFIDIVIVGGKNRARIYERPIRNLEKAVKSDVTFLKTDANGVFLSEIVQNAKEDADLSGLTSNAVAILAVIIQGKEQLSYRVIFWSKDTFDNANLDEDTYIDHVDLDLSNLGIQIAGAGQFYLTQRLDPPLLYIDEDKSRELHVSLQNIDATTKTAGVDGQVRLIFAVSPLKEEI